MEAPAGEDHGQARQGDDDALRVQVAAVVEPGAFRPMDGVVVVGVGDVWCVAHGAGVTVGPGARTGPWPFVAFAALAAGKDVVSMPPSVCRRR